MSGIPLGPYRLQSSLGRGGMGSVWRGVHAAHGLPVAVKVMLAAEARDARYRRAFRREAQAVAGLDHPGVVVVFDYGEAGAESEAASEGRIRAGSPYLAMELATGTLREMRRGLGWSCLRSLLLSLLDALAHAHARGVIHRDLKPSNVLVFPRAPGRDRVPARFKLADFGLAEVARGAPEERDAISGTPRYMAPEQVLGRWRDDGPWTDLYALGCLAWELVTGAPLFALTTTSAVIEAHLHAPPPPLRPTAPVAPGFEGWLLRLLEKAPQQRFQRAADAALALERLPPPPEERAYRRADLLDAPTGPMIDQQRTDARLPSRGQAQRAPVVRPQGAVAPRPLPPMPLTWRAPADERPRLPAGAGLGLWGLRPVPFVGREAERDRLWHELAEVARDARPRLVLLHGPAGSGKSRIAEWISERAHETGAASVLEAVHSPMAGPAEGLPRMVARFLRCQGLEGEDLVAQAGRALRRLGTPDTGEALAVARMIGPGAGGEAQSPAERHALVARLLRRAARERPVVVRLDDVQWGRDALAFCARVLRDPEPLPALFLLTAREEALADRPAESSLLDEVLAAPGSSRLELAPLPAADHHRLVEHLLGLDGALVRQIEERTEGNPLFAVQLVGDWVQRGVLQPGPGGLVLPPGETAPLPEDMHQVWSAHIDSVLRGRPLAYRTALEVAAALGLTVERGEWVAACRAAGVEPPAGLVDTLARRRLARRTDEGFSFVHGMLRESIERLAREGGRWTAHHVACAEVLRPRYTAGERGAAERLARHLLAAERPAQAVDPLLRAAAERRQTSDYPRAHVLLERRDRELDAAGLPANDPRRGDGWVLRARVFLHEGRLDAVSEWAGRARCEAEAHGWTRALSESLRLLGDAARRRGELDRAAALYQDCVALLERLDDPHGVAGSLWGLADVHRQRGRLEEAERAFRLSRDLYRRIDDAHGVADHWIGAGDVAWQRGALECAAEHYGRALELFRALGNRYGVARSLNGLGEVDRAAGRLEAARSQYEEALRLLDLVQSADALFPRVNLGLVAVAARRWDEAQARLLPVAAELEGLGWRGLLATVQAALMACDAVRAQWTSWDVRFSQAALAAQGALEPDLAWALATAADAAAPSDALRAERAAGMARAQWASLGRTSPAG